MEIGIGNGKTYILAILIVLAIGYFNKGHHGSENDAESTDADTTATAEEAEKYVGMEVPVVPVEVSEKETNLKRSSYTLSYNHDKRNPNYVAWQLPAKHTWGPFKRKDFDFTDDETMPEPNGTKEDYFNSGYDRGHLCPAGDNKWSSKAMSDCFLMTNMCPQNHELNTYLWNYIEQQCREWAKSYGTLYIACGPLYEEGEDKRTKTIGQNKVAVPDAFFKVILCMDSIPKAIGFVCPNSSQKGKRAAEFVKTVDEIESLTGYDFFSLLPDSIETLVESRYDYNQWEGDLWERSDK